jgi:hypothetical protein
MRHFIGLITAALFITAATLLGPAAARNCSFSWCLLQCSKMPDDPASGGPKYNCLKGCNSCSRGVTGGVYTSGGEANKSGGNPHGPKHPPIGVHPTPGGTLKGTSDGTATTSNSRGAKH